MESISASDDSAEMIDLLSQERDSLMNQIDEEQNRVDELLASSAQIKGEVRYYKQLIAVKSSAKRNAMLNSSSPQYSYDPSFSEFSGEHLDLLRDKQNEVERLNLESQTIHVEIEQFTTAIQDLTEEQTNLESTLTDLRNEMVRTKQKRDKRRSKLNMITTNLKEIETDIRSKTKVCADADLALSQLVERERTQHETGNGELGVTIKVYNLEEELNTLMAFIDDGEMHIMNLKREMEAMDSTQDPEQERLSRVLDWSTQESEFKEQLKKITADYEEAESQNQALGKQITVSQSRYQKIENLSKKWGHAVDDNDEELDDIDTLLAKLAKKASQKGRSTQQRASTKDTLVRENAQLNAQIRKKTEEIRKSAIKLKTEVANLKREIDKRRVGTATDEETKIAEIKKLKLKRAIKKTPTKTPSKIPIPKSPMQIH